MANIKIRTVIKQQIKCDFKTIWKIEMCRQMNPFYHLWIIVVSPNDENRSM